MRKLPYYVQYFGSNIVESVAESWVEAEMSLVEIDSNNPFVCWWSVTNRFVDDLNGAR